MSHLHLAFVCLFLTGVTGAAADTPKQTEQPNIVLLLADDLGWTGLTCFGSDLYETPNLDRLANTGMKFTNAYSACTVCSPTRASLMTGMYPARLHLTDFIDGQNRPFAKMQIPNWTKRLEPRHTTIAEALKANGYRTGHVGKWHLNARGPAATVLHPTDHGFDFSYGRPEGTRGYFLKPGTTSELGSNYLTDDLTDKACDFIKRSKSDPFFLYLAYNVPHTPIQGRKDLVKYFQDKVNPSAVHNNPTYAAMVASLDQSVGRIMKQLDESGVSDNTVIVFTSDNGGLTQRYGKHDGFTENRPLRRGKGSAYEGGVRVPTIVSWPKITEPGSVCDEPIMTIDYFTTFMQMANAASSNNTDGQSLVPLLNTSDAKFDRSLYWHYPHYHAGGDGPYSAVRSGDFRLIEFHEDHSLELYHLANDIGEQTNLATQMPDKVDRMLSDLNRWRTLVAAQMPTQNPHFDSARASEVSQLKKK